LRARFGLHTAWHLKTFNLACKLEDADVPQLADKSSAVGGGHCRQMSEDNFAFLPDRFFYRPKFRKREQLCFVATVDAVPRIQHVMNGNIACAKQTVTPHYDLPVSNQSTLM
jgi:hypothetical protein